MIELGISPRGTVARLSMAKAHAYVMGRNYVTPEDVHAVFPDVAIHRLILNPKAKISGVTFDSIIKSILQTVPVPRKKQ
jgi:MoxR-like ATPase